MSSVVGDARIAQAFSGDGAQVAALEVGFDRMVRVARRLAANTEEPALLLLMGDGAGLPFPDDVFDLVILSDVIEHAKDPEGVVQEVSRVLRPGGMLYASMPDRFSIVNLLSGPHYNVPAVGLLPRRIAAFCVTKLLRISDLCRRRMFFSPAGRPAPAQCGPDGERAEGPVRGKNTLPGKAQSPPADAG